MMKRKAFTVLELMIVIAISSLLLMYTVPQIIANFFVNELEVESQELVHVLRRAQTQSQLNLNDGTWGIYFDSGAESYTLFLGSDYASRTTSADVVYPLSGGVDLAAPSLNGGGSEIVFDQISGATSQYGTVELSGADATTSTITINSLGSVISD